MRPEGAAGPGERRLVLFHSLRLRMAVSHGAVLTAIVVLLGGASYLLLGRTLDRNATASIEAVARAEVDRMAEAGVVLPPADVDQPAGAAVRVAVFTRAGVLVGEHRDLPPWLRPRPGRVTTLAVRGARVRVVTVPVVAGGRPIGTVVAGRSLQPEEQTLAQLRLLLLTGGAIAVAVSLGAGWLLAGRALRPVRLAYDAQASFAADASHELRTPLAFVRSAVEVLAERDPALGGQALEEIDYLTGLTDRLLTLARARSGALRLDVRPVDLQALLGRAAARNERVHGLRLDLREARGAGPALADPVAVEAALDAVLENVARYGGGAATLSARDRDGHRRIVVADRGPGLAASERERVFDRFYRSDPARSRERGGAGLGLPLARSLVEAQGGAMWLEETPGGGLTAIIELRLEGDVA